MDFVGRFQNRNLSKNWIISKVFLKDFDHRFENLYDKNNSCKGSLTMGSRRDNMCFVFT